MAEALLHVQPTPPRMIAYITYGDLRIMVDVTVAATSRPEVRKMALDNIKPGIATKDAAKRKLDH
jgi:hypothetical protein